MVEDNAGFDGALDMNLGVGLDDLLGEAAEPPRSQPADLQRNLQMFRNIPVRLTLEVAVLLVIAGTLGWTVQILWR